MLVMILEKAPASLRGELSRWLIEPHTGVFLGNLSARVRDELWAKACCKSWDGAVVQIWSDTTSPQGYRYRIFGTPARTLLDHEGIALVQMPPKEPRKKKGEAGPPEQLDLPEGDDSQPST
jgi:CRISPR-associated protein Cas2